MTRGRLDWARDRALWPLAEAVRFESTGRLRWRVQDSGPADAPLALLIHGTGASTHSVAPLAKELGSRYRSVAVDLPGHAFTTGHRSPDLSLDGMAAALAVLVRHLDLRPVVVVGHSAGAAVAVRMALDGAIAPTRIVGINAALKPIEGDAFLSPLAKLLFVNPFVPRAFSMFARHSDAAGRLIRGTGSAVGEEMMRCYRRLLDDHDHVAGALGMMASWDLRPTLAALPRLAPSLTLVVAEDDPMVPPSVSRDAARLVKGAEVIAVPRGGHLVHEVDPARVAAVIAGRAGV